MSRMNEIAKVIRIEMNSIATNAIFQFDMEFTAHKNSKLKTECHQRKFRWTSYQNMREKKHRFNAIRVVCKQININKMHYIDVIGLVYCRF